MNKANTTLLRSRQQHEKWSYVSEIVIDLLLISLFFMANSHAIYWIGLPVGHAIMSAGRCYLRPLNDLDSYPTLRLSQFWARYFNEYGSWMGMVCVLFAVGLDLAGGTTNPMIIVMALGLSLALPHALLVPVLVYQMLDNYDKFRKIRVFIMAFLFLIMLLEPIAVTGFRHSFFSEWSGYTLFLWSLWLAQWGVIIPALVVRWQDKKESRKGNSQAIPVWRYGVFAFIILHGLMVVLVSG